MDQVRIVSLETLKRERREAGERVKRAKLNVPLSRLITTADGLSTLAQKVIIDVNEGRAEVPLLYTDIYDRLASDALPRNVDTNLVAQAAVVFLQRFEGDEVQFGHLSKGTFGSVPIVSYSAGFEYTEENLMYDETWAIERLNRAFGEAYNALLNDIHLNAIISFTYPGGNVTAANATGANLQERTRNTLQAAIRTAATANRPGSVLLAPSANKFQIQDALARRVDTQGNEFPAIADIETIIFYDGYSITVGEKTYAFAGVPANTAFLVMPKRRMIELVKTINGEDMIVRTGNPDISRRIADQIVAHTYRGLYVDVAGSVQKITLPT